jgi:nicotinamide riboside kinase
MIVSFSGPQSSGKTTLLNHLMKLNPNVDFVPEVTRKIRRELNLPINESGGDLTQYMIMAEHVRNIYERKQDNKLAIFDRCVLDGVVYSHWMCDEKLISENMFTAAYDIYENLIGRYDIIFYTDPNDVEIEDDGERSTSKDFRKGIIELFEYYINSREYEKIPKIEVLSGSVEKRLEKIKEILEQYNYNIII